MLSSLSSQEMGPANLEIWYFFPLFSDIFYAPSFWLPGSTPLQAVAATEEAATMTTAVVVAAVVSQLIDTFSLPLNFPLD
jgi:hypothetical protein